MSLLKILIYPNQLLRIAALPVRKDNLQSPDVVQAFSDLQETLAFRGDGAALAASQVGLPIRVVALSSKVREELPPILIDPVIAWRSDEKSTEAEGCLSFPGVSLTIERPERIVLEFIDTDGEDQRVNLGPGFLSRCVQHEVDHLDGKLFIDYLDRKTRLTVHSLMLKHKLAGK
ncbi:MAG: peptide deformylase [Acidiferrobacterales bacterium]